MLHILDNGVLKQRGVGTHGHTSKKYNITILDESHLPKIMALQKSVAIKLEQPDLLHTFSPAFMKQHLGHRGIVLGVFVQGRLVAFRNLYYPDPLDREWNLGYDLGLTGDVLAQVVNLQMVCVHPRFRGNSLAFKMNQIALGLLRECKTHPHVCATVSPLNIWNIPVLLASGFAIARLRQKYGGKIRYIVYQNLDKPISFNDNSIVSVRLDDLDTQKQILRAGYYGVSIISSQSKGSTARHFDLAFKLPCNDKATDSNEWIDYAMLTARSQGRRMSISPSPVMQ